MMPTDIDRVFGRSRLRMVTGDHVEVFREASVAGERRRYTKRFLATSAGDFRPWTEREWRILARLVGHGIGPVPDVVQFDRGASDRPALVQTYDAGVTADHWATLLPVERDGAVLAHVFEDCAHWWALARHALTALDAIHHLQVVHLDLKADNVCIPADPVDFDPHRAGAPLRLCFEQIALIDFAFSLVSGERLVSALPIARQFEYDYQSPRLLHALEAGGRGDLAPTRELDWRCDLFSLAAMLRRVLPDRTRAPVGDWTDDRHAMAHELIRRLLEVHDAELPSTRPHAELIAFASDPLQSPDLALSLQRGWTLATRASGPLGDQPTPVTRIARPVMATPVAIVKATNVDPRHDFVGSEGVTGLGGIRSGDRGSRVTGSRVTGSHDTGSHVTGSSDMGSSDMGSSDMDLGNTGSSGMRPSVSVSSSMRPSGVSPNDKGQSDMSPSVSGSGGMSPVVMSPIERGLVGRSAGAAPRGRPQRVAWAVGIVLAAALSVPVLGEGWREWQRTRATEVHATAGPASAGLPATVATSRPPERTSSRPSASTASEVRPSASVSPASADRSSASVSPASADRSSASVSPASADRS
ncbi:MAG: hypothetical protein ABIV63_18885, partial [Caldimonas sp.]